jgi:moderate conductance mechanosensitive channel
MSWKHVGDWLVSSGLAILVILLAAALVRWLLHRLIGRIVRRTLESKLPSVLEGHRATRVLASATGALSERRRQRVETLGAVLRSVVTIVVFSVAAIMVLDKVHIPIAPLLASAGVAGVALGFGAQSLVKDILSGTFLLLEDQYGVGDVIDTGSAIGEVEDVTLRVTKLRDGDGVVWYVRNGEIVRVGNRSQGWSTAIVDLPVAYTEDAERVQAVIREALQRMDDDPEWHDELIETPAVVGIEQITGTTMTVRVMAKCVPNQNLAVQREIRKRAKAALDAAGVKAPIAFPPYGGGLGAAKPPPA